MLIESTTAEDLEQGLIERIAGIVPSALRHRDAGWTPEEGNRSRATSLQARAFTVFLGAGEDVEEGLTGNADTETVMVLQVRVDYRKIPPNDLGALIVMDRQDLSDRLCDSWHPVVTGLTFSEFLGEEVVGDEKMQRYVYSFEINYLRARRTT